MPREESVVGNTLKNSIGLDETEALEEILNVNSDPDPESNLSRHLATFLGEQLQAFYAT